MPITANRLTNLSESVIREMTRVSDQYGAINLSQGFPDFDPPPELILAAKQALEEGHNQYALTWGAPRFRQALARKQSHFMGIPIDPENNVTVTCGSTEAIVASVMAICNPGDKVAIFSPYYENYAPAITFSGGEVVYIPLHPPNFSFEFDALQQAFNLGLRALILCNPSNPTGKVFTHLELDTIASLAREHDVFIITDEVYEHIVYPPCQHTYIASFPGMFERTISCSSLSKTYAITGWRIGYVIAAPKVSDEIRKVHDFLTVCAPAPLQEAAVTALDFPLTYYHQLCNEYSHRKEVFLNYLQEAGLKYSQPQGAYYVLVDISPFITNSQNKFGFTNDVEFCIWMAKKIGVAAVPGSSFFHEPVNHLIRLNFAKSINTLVAAGERLSHLGQIV
jgi:aspartate/methionine/tyrosine aminotransferase